MTSFFQGLILLEILLKKKSMNNLLLLDKNLKDLFYKKDPFRVVEELEGKIYREYANRVTKEFNLNNQRYFVKYHKEVGWKEIFKNLIQFKLPVIGAKQEWIALNKLKSLQISCPEPVAFFSRGTNPAKRYSFIITKALINTISLEDLLIKEKKVLSLNKKRELIERLALLSRRLHLNGINHRDFYLCHFHVLKEQDFSKGKIFLIDLHRAQIRKKVPKRWITKDIGGLLHSAMSLGLSERDSYRFLEIYFNKSLRQILKEKRGFIRSIRKRALHMYMNPILKEINIKAEKAEPNSQYLLGKEEGKRWIAKKSFFNQGLSKVIAHPDEFMSKGEEIKFEKGNHIVAVDLPKYSIFIKNFQLKGIIHYLRKFFSRTRAITAWEASHWLNIVGIKTITPLAVIETYDMFTTKESYLITLKQSGERLDQIEITSLLEKLIPNRMSALLKRLNWIGFNHGDAKGSNFFFDNKSLIVSDLDDCKRRLFQIILKKKLFKDKKRILKSFDSYPRIKESLSRRF